MKNTSNLELSFINEDTFDNFYYSTIFDSSLKQSNLNVYQNLSNFNINFNKEPLEFLKNKNYELDSIKIIRRKLSNGTSKGIIKFKLILPGHDTISTDIIKSIDLKSFNWKDYTIKYNDIYYNNNIDIIAYINDLNDNIKDVKIINNFGGEIKAKHILNIKGSGETREMLKKLKNNIEKLFLFPFFKLFEIFYISYDEEDKYKKLKKENFGDNFNSLNIVKPFEGQIKTLNELLFLTRPDLLGKYKNEYFIEFIKKYNEETKDKEDNKENEEKKENEDMKGNNKKKENKDKEENKEKENKDKEEREAKEKLIKEHARNENFHKYNIVYVDSLSFEGDILRTLLRKIPTESNSEFQRGNQVIIIDEVDNMCVDNLDSATQLVSQFGG